MSTPTDLPARAERRAHERGLSKTASHVEPKKGVGGKYGAYLFGGIVALVLLAGAWFAFGNFLTRPATAAGAISVQSSMAGFTPSEIHVTAGSTATFDWWTEDAAMHLENGVHTMVSDTLGIHYRLAAQSKESISFRAPTQPGSYDYWCDSCCGGKASDDMHGSIVVEE